MIQGPFCDHGCRNRVTRNCNSGISCRVLMGCAKCGGRMLTKVGRRKPMLICSDCGHPISDNATPERRRLMLSSARLMAGLLAVASLTLVLSRLREANLEQAQPTAADQGGQADEAD